MTLTDAARTPGVKPVRARQDGPATNWVQRAWSASLIVHAATLVAVMVAVAAFIGTGSVFTDDEGAGILQAQAIQHGHWTIANPLPSVDPRATDYPIHQPARGTKGIAPLGKNLLYFAALAALGLLLGTAGMVGLSIAGTVAAALLAARLAREVGASERASFWLVGLASPLFFDGFLVVAHTVAAALAAASALLALRFLRTGRPLTLVGALLCVAGAALLRTEGVLWALGLAVAALGTTLRPGARYENARRGILLSVGSIAAVLIAWKGDSLLTRYAIGSPVSAPAGTIGGTGTRGTVSDQVLGLLRSWFALTGASRIAFAVIVVVLGLVAVWARRARQGRFGARSTLALAAAVAAYSIYLALFGANQYVAGIAIVFPLLWAGLWLLGRLSLRSTSVRLLVVASAVYAVLVAGTEYSDAGAWQPGRYFLLAVPVIVPVVTAALAGPLRQIAPAARTLAVGCVVVAIAATTTSAVSSLRLAHQRSGGLAAAVLAFAAEAPPGDGGLPVVVTTYPFLPRSEWVTFPSIRWQLVSQNRLASYGVALAGAGIRHFVLVTIEPRAELSALKASYIPTKIDETGPGSPWRVIVLKQA